VQFTELHARSGDLFGRLASGGKVTVDLDANDKVQLIFAEEEAASVA
jgi:ATP-dependent Clp protease ATP-binding subunit ClpA